MVKTINFACLMIVFIYVRPAYSSQKIYWNTCLGNEPFMYLVKMSVQDCRISCAKRNHCVAVSYHRLSHVCQLHEVTGSMTSCTGFHVMLRSDFLSEEEDACNGDCQVSDCNRIPSVDKADTFGNLLDIGALIKIKCVHGDSESNVTCQPNGQWTKLPVCPDDCGAVPIVANAKETYTTTLTGSIVKYTCNGGYTVSPAQASMSITCLETGVWEPVSFTCKALVGSSCSIDTDCIDNGRCLFTGESAKGSRCYCKALYEFSQTHSACTQVCESYNVLKKYSNEYVRYHNVGGSNGKVLAEEECVQYCEDNYADTYLSVDHLFNQEYSTNCFCNSVNREQVLESSPELLYTSSDHNLFSKTCHK